MRLQLEPATDADAAAIAAVRLADSRQLTEQHGRGTWSFAAESEAGVLADMMTASVFVARREGGLAATLRLSTRPPWLGKFDFFTPCEKPLYLTSMAVEPACQRQGIGRQCLAEVRRIARDWRAGGVRLDAYDAAAGAGEFYRRNGYHEVRRASYHGTPLIFFEWLSSAPAEPGSPAMAAGQL